MARWTPAPVAGGAYTDVSRPWTVQDTVNLIPVRAERPGGRSDLKLAPAPGTRLFAVVGDGPIRGARDVEGRLFVVSGTGLYLVNADTSSTLLGTIPGSGRVSLTHNQESGGSTVVVANGFSGFTYNTATEVFAEITDPGFPGAITVDFLDQYITGIEPDRRYAFHSELANAASYNTLDRYVAESAPDRLVGQIADNGQWWLFGERTTEVYTNTGAATGTFQRIPGATMERGLAAPFALARLDNSIFFLGDDGSVYRTSGYSPLRISTHPIEQAISRCDTSQAFAFTYEDRGHKVFYLTLPDGQTWGYDVATQEWHRRQSYGLSRWKMATLTKWRGVWIAGDYQLGRLYQVDWGLESEDGEPLIAERITGVLHDSQNRVTVHAVELVLDTGIGETLPVGPGDIIDPLTLSNPLPVVYEGIAIEPHQYRAAGGIRPYLFAITAGALPAGLSMDANGLVTGTPSAAGSYAWRVQVTDVRGITATLDQGVDLANGIDGGDVYSVGNTPPALMTNRRTYNGARDALAPAGVDVGWGNAFDRFAYSPDGLYAAGSELGQPGGTFFQLRKYDAVTQTWSALANPADMPPEGPAWMAFSPDGNYLACVGTSTNADDRLIVYRRDGDTFTRIASPADPPTTQDLRFVAWDDDGSRLIVVQATTGNSLVKYDFYAPTGLIFNRQVISTSFLGVQWVTAYFLPGTGSRYLLVASEDFVAVVNLTGGTVAAYQAEDGRGGAVWDASGGYAIVAGWTAPNYLKVYDFDGSVIGSETLTFVANAANQPSSFPLNISRTSDGAYLAVGVNANHPEIFDLGGALPPAVTKLTNPTDIGGGVAFVVWSEVDL